MIHKIDLKSRSLGIDFLRGLFAVWVIFVHLAPWSHYVNNRTENNFLDNMMLVLLKAFNSSGETHPAVLGFIVLSGYCIHRSTLLKAAPFNLRSYAIRRFFRIYPTYVLAVIIGILLYDLSSDISKTQTVYLTVCNEITLPLILYKLLGISSFIPSLHYEAFEGNAPLATVMVEMWLYALYAFIIIKTRTTIEIKKIYKFILMPYVAILFILHIKPSYLGWWHNGSYFSFALYWWIGAYICQCKKLPLKTQIIIFSSWAFLNTLIIFGDIEFLFLIEVRKILLAIVFGILIKKTEERPFRWYVLGKLIGEASYSIYAFHAPIIIYVLISTKNELLSFFVTILISFVFYFLCEKPSIALGKKLMHNFAYHNKMH